VENRLSWLLLALQVILSAVLLVAATEKMLRSEEFFAALRLSHLPVGSIAPFGTRADADPGVPLVQTRNGDTGLSFLRLGLSRFRRACLS
jgi:hypothetical protein